MFKFKSLSTKITIACIISLMIIISIVVSILTFNSSRIFNGLFHDEANICMHSLTTSIDNEIASAKAICTTYAKKTGVVWSFTNNNNSALVQSTYEIFEMTSADVIFYANAKGEIVCSSTNSYNFSGLDCTKTALSGTANSSYQIFNGNEIYAAYSTPVYDGKTVVGSMTTL